MLQALADAGIWPPDELIGTSVGALNAAWVAGHPSAADLAGLVEVWKGMRRRDVFPFAGVAGLAGRSDHLLSSDGLRSLLERHLTFSVLEEAAIPLQVVATDVTSGSEVALTRGPAVPAILASAAIPGFFAPQVIDGRALFDGGVADNTPISHAVSGGATTVYVLPGSYPCTLDGPPPTALGMVLQAINLMVHARLAHDVERYESRTRLLVVPPLCPLSVSPVDFRHSAALIEKAHTSTTEWLAAGPVGTGQASMLRSG
jgi:NTE family protein